MRPSREETAASVGRLKGFPLKRGADWPGVLMVSASSPSRDHFVTVCEPSSAQ